MAILIGRRTQMKIKYHVWKYKELFAFILISLFIVSFFFVHAKHSFYSKSEPLEHSKAIKLNKIDHISQELKTDKTLPLAKVAVEFGTYSRKNQGFLHVQLFENKTCISEWHYDTARLADNAYQEFSLDKPYTLHPQDSYYLCISEDYSGDNAVAFWTSDEKGGSCWQNRRLLQGKSLCYQLTYTNQKLKNRGILLAVLIFLIFGILIACKLDEKLLMSGLFLTLGILYMCACPQYIAPDEDHHFLRAFEISCGTFISPHTEKSGGNFLPAALSESSDSDILDWNDTKYLNFTNTSLYTPVTYLPQAVGIKIARCFTNRVSGIFYGGKYANFLASLLLCLAAIYWMPFGQKILFMIMTFPMTIQEMISMSPDGFTISLCLFFIAYVFHLSYGNVEKLRKRDFCILAGLSLMIALCKIVYVVLLLLTFIIPNHKIGERKTWMGLKFGIFSMALAANLIWLKISSVYLVEIRPGVNAAEQIRYILLNIGDFYGVAVRTLMENSDYFIKTMFGDPMGALNIALSPFVWITFLFLFLYEIYDSRRPTLKLHSFDPLVMALIFLGGSGLIFTSLYVQWTALRNEVIEGIQGRYFIPLIIFPALLAMYRQDKNREKETNVSVCEKSGQYYYLILLTLNGIALLDIVQYYL